MDKLTSLRDNIRTNVRTIATSAVLVALALVLSLVENWIPLGFLVPGIRLGLANVSTVFALYLLGPLPALVVLVLRCLLGSMFAGTFTAFLFSLTGGLLAFLCMWLLSLSRHMSPLGICVGGAGAHNIGQILMACLVLGSKAPIAYLPVLLLVSILTGLITGIVCSLTLGGLHGGYFIADRIQSHRGFRPDPDLFNDDTVDSPTLARAVSVRQAERAAAPQPVPGEAPVEPESQETYDDFINSDVWAYVNSEYEEKSLPETEASADGTSYEDIMARIRSAAREQPEPDPSTDSNRSAD